MTRMAPEIIVGVMWGSIIGVNYHAVDRSDKEFAKGDLFVPIQVHR